MIQLNRLLFVAFLALAALSAFPAGAQSPSLIGAANVLNNSSGNLAATAGGTTLTSPKGEYAWLCGFAVTGSGATAASVIDVTVTGLGSGGTQHYELAIPAGVNAPVNPLIVNMNPCQPSAAQNGTITITVPSFGAGNTNSATAAWGFNQ